MGFGIAFIGLFAGAMNIAEWREKGVVRVLRCAPMSAYQILACSLTVATVSAWIQTILIAVVSVTQMVGMTLSVWAALSVIPVFLGTLLYYSLGVLIGQVVPTISAVSFIISLIVMPMGVVSGAVMPLEALPNWVQTVSEFLPLTYLLDAIRWPLTGVAPLSDCLRGCGLTAAAGILLFWLSARFMRWN